MSRVVADGGRGGWSKAMLGGAKGENGVGGGGYRGAVGSG